MNPAQRPMPDHAPLVGGRLLLADRGGGRLSVALEGGGEVVARRAASCLLAPVPGDRVLVTLTPEPFVLAVLERASGAAAELSLDGDARLRVRGQLTLEADQGIDLVSRERVSVVSRLFDVTAGEGRLTLKRLTAVARAAAVSFDTLGALARACDLVAERMSQKLGRSYRVVEDTDQLRARHIDHRAEQTAQLKGETTVVVAEQVARIDGAQVTIG